jgi:hypothetical protein
MEVGKEKADEDEGSIGKVIVLLIRADGAT